MNDKDRPIDERIAAAAREQYHPPPETPRDEMWTVIGERLAHDESTDGPEDVTPIRPSVKGARPVRPRLPGHAGWWVGIAAALLIGLGLGRLTLGGGAESPTVAGTPSRDETAVAEVRPPTDESTGAPAPDTTGTAVVPRRSPDRIAAASPSAAERVPETAAADETPTGRTLSAPKPPLPYRVATRKHLDSSESFLAVARSGLAQAEDDPEFGTWARSLLARTRLLLSSPAAEEPETRRLLQDLELMLAQIVVSVETGDPAETRITGEGLQESDLLLRLRSAAEGGRAGQGAPRPVRSSSL